MPRPPNDFGLGRRRGTRRRRRRTHSTGTRRWTGRHTFDSLPIGDRRGSRAVGCVRSRPGLRGRVSLCDPGPTSQRRTHSQRQGSSAQPGIRLSALAPARTSPARVLLQLRIDHSRNSSPAVAGLIYRREARQPGASRRDGTPTYVTFFGYVNIFIDRSSSAAPGRTGRVTTSVGRTPRLSPPSTPLSTRARTVPRNERHSLDIDAEVTGCRYTSPGQTTRAITTTTEVASSE